LLHGYPSSCYLWRHCMTSLAERFRVYAPDLPGHGRSDKPLDVDYNLDFFTDFLLDFYDALQLENPGLVVHDLGGTAGLGFTARHPERVKRLVVMDTGPYVEWPFMMRALVWTFQRKSLTNLLLKPSVYKKVMQWGAFYNRDVVGDEMLAFYRDPWVEKPEGREAFRRVIAAPPAEMTEPRENLRKINIPTLILWAENDRLFPVSVARRLQGDIPGAALATVPNCGHFIPEEQPETVVAHLMDFF
ncbi:MAG: alpha/beta hydrolase, partial [Desulfobacterales bacterium]|nr:alpha/beta hydrolase [Desulfobacterales bacterium]